MVKDMMDAWMPQQRDLGPRNGNWSLTRKTNFSPKLAKFFFLFPENYLNNVRDTVDKDS